MNDYSSYRLHSYRCNISFKYVEIWICIIISDFHIDVLPDALATSCEKCNAKQRQIVRKISNYLKEYAPKTWLMFLDKYDPNKKYIATFELFLTQMEE